MEQCLGGGQRLGCQQGLANAASGQPAAEPLRREGGLLIQLPGFHYGDFCLTAVNLPLQYRKAVLGMLSLTQMWVVWDWVVSMK